LKDKINELESNTKNKNIRDLYRSINEFKKGYQPRTNLVEGEKCDLLADPHKIVNRWMDYFCQVLNVQRVRGIRQTEIQTADPFVPEPSMSEVEVAIGKLKRYKSPGADRIPAELIQAGGQYILRYTNSLGSFGRKKNRPTSGRDQLTCLFTPRVIKLSVVIIGAYHFCQLHANCYHNILLSRLIPYAD
jgi:hypothetical protein